MYATQLTDSNFALTRGVGVDTPAGLAYPVWTITQGTVAKGTIALSAPSTLPWSGPSLFVPVACNGDVVIGTDSCSVARVAGTGQVLWQTLVPTLPLAGLVGENACGSPRAGPACNQILIENCLQKSLGPLKFEWLACQLIGVDAGTGGLLWTSPLATGKDESYVGTLASAGLVVRWAMDMGAAPGQGTIRWYSASSGRLIGERKGAIWPIETIPQAVTQVPGDLLTFWVGEDESAADAGWPAAAFGFADNWGNTKCETSGPCWQKNYADCTDSNPCTSDLCDAAHNGCYHVPLPEGITCSDTGSHCTAGTCK